MKAYFQYNEKTEQFEVFSGPIVNESNGISSSVLVSSDNEEGSAIKLVNDLNRWASAAVAIERDRVIKIVRARQRQAQWDIEQSTKANGTPWHGALAVNEVCEYFITVLTDIGQFEEVHVTKTV